MKPWLLLLLSLFAGSAAADDLTRYQADVSGRITIGPEGQVLDVEFEQADWMGEAVRQGYEGKIRAWRFEPVLEEGRAITASARMKLRLAAVRNDTDKTASFVIEHASFPDPEPLAEADAARLTDGIRRRPRYPASAAQNGVGAIVLLVARLDAEGKPEALAVEQLLLTGPDPGKSADLFANQFEKQTLAAARHWRLVPPEGTDVVRIPVRFLAPGASSRRSGWEAVYPVGRELPAWLHALHGEGKVVLDLSEDGRADAPGLKLLTPLDAPVEG